MNVESVRLDNFKCFANQTYEFAKQFTLLVGDNGKGKTSILDGLAVGLGSLFLGFPEPAKQRSIERQEVRLKFFEQGETTTAEKQFPAKVTCKGNVFDANGEWTRELTSAEGRTTRQDASWIKDKADAVHTEVQNGDPVVLPVVSYYGTGRLWKQIRDRPVEVVGPNSRFMGYLDCLNPASDAKRLIEWFKTQEMAAIQRGTTLKTLEACRKSIIACVPDADRVYFDVSDDQLKLDINGEALPFDYLSDGYRNALAMVADIAVRAATLNPSLEADAVLKTPGVVLIDEIDLHLHPKWQRQVVDDLISAFPCIQFIATTHSPFVIQSLPNRPHVRLLNLDDEEADEYVNMSVEDITENVQGVDIPQRSQRYREMMEAAEKYYSVLRDANGATPERVEELKQRLDRLSLPFSDDPAYQAFLRSQRIAAGIDDQEGE